MNWFEDNASFLSYEKVLIVQIKIKFQKKLIFWLAFMYCTWKVAKHETAKHWRKKILYSVKIFLWQHIVNSLPKEFKKLIKSLKTSSW